MYRIIYIYILNIWKCFPRYNFHIELNDLPPWQTPINRESSHEPWWLFALLWKEEKIHLNTWKYRLKHLIIWHSHHIQWIFHPFHAQYEYFPLNYLCALIKGWNAHDPSPSLGFSSWTKFLIPFHAPKKSACCSWCLMNVHNS